MASSTLLQDLNSDIISSKQNKKLKKGKTTRETSRVGSKYSYRSSTASRSSKSNRSAQKSESNTSHFSSNVRRLLVRTDKPAYEPDEEPLSSDKHKQGRAHSRPGESKSALSISTVQTFNIPLTPRPTNAKLNTQKTKNTQFDLLKADEPQKPRIEVTHEEGEGEGEQDAVYVLCDRRYHKRFRKAPTETEAEQAQREAEEALRRDLCPLVCPPKRIRKCFKQCKMDKHVKQFRTDKEQCEEDNVDEYLNMLQPKPSIEIDQVRKTIYERYNITADDVRYRDAGECGEVDCPACFYLLGPGEAADSDDSEEYEGEEHRPSQLTHDGKPDAPDPAKLLSKTNGGRKKKKKQKKKPEIKFQPNRKGWDEGDWKAVGILLGGAIGLLLVVGGAVKAATSPAA